MKKEVAVICKAYEDWCGAQIKKEIVKCEDEKAAIAYAANFVAGLKDDNAVKIRFIGEDTDVDYIIDDDELADASAKISAMVSAYETVEENDEDKTLEVGKTYIAYKYNFHTLIGTYKAQVIRRTKKTVTVEVWRDGSNHKETFKNRKIFLGGSGDVLDEGVEYFRVYYVNENLNFKANRFDREQATEKYVEDDGSNDDPDEEDEVLTVDYSVDDEDEDDELVDEAEVITVEEKVIATADLEKELTRIKGHVEVMKEIIFDNNVAIKDNQKKILEYIAAIMTNENAITAYGVENISLGNKIDELEEKAAALEAEILNRKITESYADSIVTTAAFDASIEGEMLAAVYEPVTFELERFNDETAIEETVAIDTAVTTSEIPIVDEGAEDEYNSTLNKFNDEIANIKTQIEKLQEEIIMPLQKKLEESVKQRNLHIRAMEKWVQKKIPEVTLTEYIKLTSQHGTTTATLRKEDDCNNRLFVDGDSNGGFKISDYKKTLASYSTLKAFKAAILELAAAIERGDKKFTFPADK